MKKDLLNQKFGRLLVVEKLGIVIDGGNKCQNWKCLCDCGNFTEVKTYHLTKGSIKSCGCLKVKNIKGQKFNKLIALKYLGNSNWECLCDCGNFTIVKSNKLRNNHTKSCGCLVKEQGKKNIIKATNKRRKFTPLISSARKIWSRYCNMDGYSMKTAIITFDDFFKLSQQNCYYCSSTPQNIHNGFKYIYYKGSDDGKENGDFIYNGLDRIDNNLPHFVENCVPCCIVCNRTKNKKSLKEYVQYLLNLKIKNSYILPINLKPIDNKIKSIVKTIWNQNYNDGNLSLLEFYSMSQENCFYCDQYPENKQKEFIYNGLDRINNKLPHNKENLVPCCRSCNFGRCDLTFEEFIEWIKKIQFKILSSSNSSKLSEELSL